MPYVRVWVHMNWTTKNKERIITPGLKRQLLPHILENAAEKHIYIDTVNCVEDHIHLVISLGATQTLSKIAQLIKGESSRWVNVSGLLKRKFEWQDDYFAISASESAIPYIRRYIENQEEHHRRKSYEEEYDEYIKGHAPAPPTPPT